MPVREDRALLELIVLEGAQAGLSWRTVLERRAGYRRAFADFAPASVAAMGEDSLSALLADPGLIRHPGKLRSAWVNARALLAVAAEHGSFASWLWGQVPGAPRHGGWRGPADVPVTTPESVAVSAALRRRGFTFVGPVTCQSLLQSAGLLQDHLRSCPRYRLLGGPAPAERADPRP